MLGVLNDNSLDLDATNAVLDTYNPNAIVGWAANAFADCLVMSSLFGAESAALIHMTIRVCRISGSSLLIRAISFPKRTRLWRSCDSGSTSTCGPIAPATTPAHTFSGPRETDLDRPAKRRSLLRCQ